MSKKLGGVTPKTSFHTLAELPHKFAAGESLHPELVFVAWLYSTPDTVALATRSRWPCAEGNSTRRQQLIHNLISPQRIYQYHINLSCQCIKHRAIENTPELWESTTIPTDQ